jgi:hypothetical protein
VEYLGDDGSEFKVSIDTDVTPLYLYQEEENKPVYIYQEEEDKPVYIYQESEIT